MLNFIIAPFPPPLGGVGVAASNVRAVLSAGPGQVESFDTSSGAAREDLYRRKGLRSYARNLLLFLRLCVRTFPIARRDGVFHLFVTSDSAFLRDALFMVALRVQRKRVVVHLHSKTTGEFFLTPGRLPLFGRLLSMGEQVFVLSEKHREFFGRYIPERKLVVLENFVWRKQFVAGRDSRASDMLYLSRLSSQKGIWDLLDAVDSLKNRHGYDDLRVTVAGAADTEETECRIRRFIEDRGLSRVVRLTGVVTGAEKTAAYRDHGVFLFPSRFENSPVVLKEATQAQMAIIASDIPPNLTLLERCGNHLAYPAGDSEALARTMMRVIDDGELYRGLRQRARACRKFDEEYARAVLAPFLT
jgi:glycosyltransferase involved in cell wall biosynthesis